MMEEIRIKLSALWVSLMLTYLLGDVLRVFSGDFEAGEMMGMDASLALYLVAAVMMVIPIVMLFLSLTLKYPAIRWLSIIAATLLFVFNAIGLPTYRSAYDIFLIVVGLGFNVVTVCYAWKWGEK